MQMCNVQGSEILNKKSNNNLIKAGRLWPVAIKVNLTKNICLIVDNVKFPFLYTVIYNLLQTTNNLYSMLFNLFIYFWSGIFIPV